MDLKLRSALPTTNGACPHALVFIIALRWIRELPLHLSPNRALDVLRDFLQSSYVIGTFSLTIQEHWLLKVPMMVVSSKGSPFGPILCIACTFCKSDASRVGPSSSLTSCCYRSLQLKKCPRRDRVLPPPPLLLRPSLIIRIRVTTDIPLVPTHAIVRTALQILVYAPI